MNKQKSEIQGRDDYLQMHGMCKFYHPEVKYEWSGWGAGIEVDRNKTAGEQEKLVRRPWTNSVPGWELKCVIIKYVGLMRPEKRNGSVHKH